MPRGKLLEEVILTAAERGAIIAPRDAPCRRGGDPLAQNARCQTEKKVLHRLTPKTPDREVPSRCCGVKVNKALPSRGVGGAALGEGSSFTRPPFRRHPSERVVPFA